MQSQTHHFFLIDSLPLFVYLVYVAYLNCVFSLFQLL